MRRRQLINSLSPRHSVHHRFQDGVYKSCKDYVLNITLPTFSKCQYKTPLFTFSTPSISQLDIIPPFLYRLIILNRKITNTPYMQNLKTFLLE